MKGIAYFFLVRLHFYYDKLQVFFVFDEQQSEKFPQFSVSFNYNMFSLYRWQKPKLGELQYAELGELTGRGQKATMPRVSGADTVYVYIKS